MFLHILRPVFFLSPAMDCSVPEYAGAHSCSVPIVCFKEQLILSLLSRQLASPAVEMWMEGEVARDQAPGHTT